MKIALLSKECTNNGGIGTYLLNLCSAFREAGHEVVLIHSNPNLSPLLSSISQRFCIEGFDVYGTKDENWGSTVQVIELLKNVKPCIVHIHENNNFILESEIRNLFPVVKTLHVYDYCPSRGKFHYALNRVCQHKTSLMCLARMMYKRCVLSKRPSVIWQDYQRCVDANENNRHYRKLVVGSKYVKKEAVASGYPASQVEVVPYFTKLPDFRSIKEIKENDERNILFVGRVYREKGLDVLISALSQVKKPWQLTVVGEGMDLPRVKRLALKYGLRNRINYLGWLNRNEIVCQYQRASLVVVPSLWPEPFGIVGIEALSYGRPVVAFNVGGISDWLENNVSGFLINPYDANEMAKKISHLLKNPSIVHEMGIRGRKRVEQDFDQNKHITKLLKIYNEVIETIK